MDGDAAALAIVQAMSTEHAGLDPEGASIAVLLSPFDTPEQVDLLRRALPPRAATYCLQPPSRFCS